MKLLNMKKKILELEAFLFHILLKVPCQMLLVFLLFAYILMLCFLLLILLVLVIVLLLFLEKVVTTFFKRLCYSAHLDSAFICITVIRIITDDNMVKHSDIECLCCRCCRLCQLIIFYTRFGVSARMIV